jgi:hypothetical protein
MNEKVMIKIIGGYSVTSPAPLSMTNLNLLWFNPTINLYIFTQNPVTVNTLYQIQITSNNPQPYQMANYMMGNSIEMTFYSGYQPHTDYLVNQTSYSLFGPNQPLVTLDTSVLSDINTAIISGTQVLVKLTVKVDQSYSLLAKHLDDRL